MYSKNNRPRREHVDWHNWLAQQPCSHCGSISGCHVHHMYGASAKHNKVWIGQLACINLCPRCHGEMHQHRRRRELEKTYFMRRLREYMSDTGRVFPDNEIDAVMDYHR